MPARSVICEHKRLWTTCPTCGKEVMEAAKHSAPPEEDFSGPTPSFRTQAEAPPEEEA